MKMLLLALLILLSQVKSPSATAPGIHCVVPADYPPSSPGDQPCLTLDQYAMLNNFTSGTTLQFLPGNHSLELTLNMKEISNVTLTRRDCNSTVNIICSNVGKIQCMNVTGLKIEGLRFILAYGGYKISSAVAFIHCIEILIANTTFEGTEKNKARAVYCTNTKATIWKCNFESNRVSGYVGGAILMTNNTSMTIRGSSFIGNQARPHGGAVYASRSSLLLYSNNFTNNYASAGGALSLGSSMLSILGEVHFLANKAKRGGAIYMFSTNATFNGSIILSDNSAVLQYGGAMCINRSSAILLGMLQ